MLGDLPALVFSSTEPFCRQTVSDPLHGKSGESLCVWGACACDGDWYRNWYQEVGLCCDKPDLVVYGTAQDNHTGKCFPRFNCQGHTETTTAGIEGVFWASGWHLMALSSCAGFAGMQNAS